MTAIEIKVTPGAILGYDDPRLVEFWKDPTSWTIRLEAYEYLDIERDMRTFNITKAAALPVRDGFSIGYMTKLNEQRWGANLTIDLSAQEIRVQVDLQSPIMLVTFALTKA